MSLACALRSKDGGMSMIEFNQFRKAPAGVPLKLQDNPERAGHITVAGRLVRLVDEQDGEKVEQILADNLLFKRGFKRALILTYGELNSDRAIAQASQQRSSANLANADDICKEDVDLIIVRANIIRNTPMMDEFFQPCFPLDQTPWRDHPEARFETLYVEMYHRGPHRRLNYLSLGDLRSPTLIDWAKAKVSGDDFFRQRQCDIDDISYLAAGAICSFAKARKADLISSLMLIREQFHPDIFPRIVGFILRRGRPALSSPVEQ